MKARISYTKDSASGNSFYLYFQPGVMKKQHMSFFVLIFPFCLWAAVIMSSSKPAMTLFLRGKKPRKKKTSK